LVNGTIKVNSTLGEGTEFIITIPTMKKLENGKLIKNKAENSYSSNSHLYPSSVKTVIILFLVKSEPSTLRILSQSSRSKFILDSGNSVLSRSTIAKEVFLLGTVVLNISIVINFTNQFLSSLTLVDESLEILTRYIKSFRRNLFNKEG
jgi:hypothetical protein